MNVDRQCQHCAHFMRLKCLDRHAGVCELRRARRPLYNLAEHMCDVVLRDGQRAFALKQVRA